MNEISKINKEMQNVEVTKELLKEMLCPTATDAELKFAVGICKSYGLNPFKREIHIVKYGNSPASVIVGYEVYIKRAREFETYENFKCWIDGQGEDMKAICEIYDSRWKNPFIWESYIEECQQLTREGKVNKNWSTKPKFMLRKVCIAQAHRLAYPSEFGGMPYIEEEAPIDRDEQPKDTPEMPRAKEESDSLQQPHSQDLIPCQGCGKKNVTEKVYDYSMKKFKGVYCYECQKGR